MPRVSLLLSAARAGPDRVAVTLESLRRQELPDWEVVLVGGAWTGAEDARVVTVESDPAATPSTATGAGLARATGEFVALVDAGDQLHPAALARVAAVVDEAGDVDYVYTDEDEIDDGGCRRRPFYKPGWSPERLTCQMYTGRLGVMRRTLVERVGGFRTDVDGALEHDVALRLTEHARNVAHVPEALYHRLAGRAGPVPRGNGEAGRRAVAAHVERTGLQATVEVDSRCPGSYRLRPALRDEPLVTIVIPTGGTSRMVYGTPLNLVVNCVANIVERSTYGRYEIVCVVDESADPAVRTALAETGGDRLRLVRYAHRFNFSHKINLGALHARGDVLLLLNDDTQVITPEWIEALLVFALRERVGAVGSKLLFADGRIQHCGVVAISGDPGHPYYGFPRDHEGYGSNARVPSNCLAVTGACLMTRRECFEAVGGLSLAFPLNYNDVDYCLKLRHEGNRVVLDPAVELYHFESSSRAPGPVATEELDLLRARWGSVLRRDPYYNPNFAPGPDFLPAVRFGEERALPLDSGTRMRS